MKKFVRFLSLLTALAVVLASFAACGKQPEPDTTAPVETPTEAVETTEAVTEAITKEVTEPATQAQTEPETTEAPATEAAETTKPEETTAEDKIPQTKEEIVALYNESVNHVKSDSKSIVNNYTLNTQTSDATISNKMLQGIANKLISANMGYDKKKENISFTTVSDKTNNFPVRGQTWSSKLTAADLSKATCTEKDGVYTVTLYLIPDTTPNIKPGQGHAGKAFSIITKDSIVEGAGSLGMSVIEEDSIKLTFKDCKITAKIDKETGRMLSGNYYQDWTLSLTALGIDVSVSFGAEDDYKINW